MSPEELARLVRDMRDAQRAYFRDRRTVDLERSKSLERQVDATVKAILDPAPAKLPGF